MNTDNQSHSLDELINDGWVDAKFPPNSDRIVQLAWDDGSYGESSLGFYDGIAIIPDDGKRYYWTLKPLHIIKDPSNVLAWRDKL